VASERRLEWPAWLTRADAWRRRLGSEIVLLPETLKHLREGVENFRRAMDPETLDHLREGVENFRRATDPETVEHLREGVENFRHATDPETLDRLREGVENFRRVTQRLVDATAGIEQLSDMQSSFSEVRQRVEEANRAFREQVTAVPGGDRVAGALQDLNDTLSRWNPFWPRPPRRGPT
jgi:small-conductance mechanosensitive channel